MVTLFQDLKYGLRTLTKTRGFTIVAVVTLALGIGASTAVFSLVNAILLKPLPYPNSERIVIPRRLAPAGLNLGYEEIPWDLREFHVLRRESKAFQHLGAFKSDSFNLTGSGDPLRLEGIRASAGFFPALGVAPEIGRVFTSAEDQPGHEHEVILTDQLWRDRFSSDPAILGRAVELNGSPYTVVGVMPPGFAFPRSTEMPGSFPFPREAQLWVPLALPPAPLHPYDPSELAVIGRLKPGVSIRQAQAEMDVFARRLEQQYGPQGKDWFNSRVTPLAHQVAGDTRRPLLLILGAVGVVLLIACSNVASLLLARSLGRRREFTLRAALGAGNARLLRQLLTESLLLAVAGGAVGVLLAELGIEFVTTFAPSNIPRLADVALDFQVFAFALGITLVTGILFGLAPAIPATRENLADALREGGQRSVDNAAGPKIRKALLVSEVALALVLVIAASLLTQTFFRLLRADPGFRPARVLTFELSLPDAKYAETNRIVALYDKVLGQLQTLPGVEAAGIAKTVPLDGAPDSSSIRIIGRPAKSEVDRPFASYNLASRGYFSAVGTPLLRGREFQASDTAVSTPVAIINRAMANRYWPGENPIGKQLGLGSVRFPVMTIVGMVADVKDLSLRQQPGPEMYIPYSQKTYVSLLTMQVALRTKTDPAFMLESARQAIRSIDPGLPIAKVATMTALVDNSMAQPRFAMLVLGSFGALALVLACIGMYGVVSYSVAQRTREIGVRMALGAARRDVFRMVLGQGARLAGLGIVIGLVAALAVTRLMAGFLYGVEAADPLTFAGVSLLLVGIALLACYVPARRATRVDPMIALRYE
ncbi:MAG TPA: ABC transporter permease [Bryobacteraceae bacterium]|nr:ABC transporter permease [Bryobacteraceae bacterium]